MKLEIDIENLIKIGIDPKVYIYVQLLYEGKHDIAELFFQEQFSDIRSTLYYRRMDTYSIITPKGIALFGRKAEAIEDWIELYRGMFPVRCKGDKIGCVKKMKKFIQTHKYSKETILKATAQYLKESRRDDYKYTKRADYFIEKERISFLGSFCERVDAGEDFNADEIDLYKNTKLI